MNRSSKVPSYIYARRVFLRDFRRYGDILYLAARNNAHRRLTHFLDRRVSQTWLTTRPIRGARSIECRLKAPSGWHNDELIGSSLIALLSAAVTVRHCARFIAAWLAFINLHRSNRNWTRFALSQICHFTSPDFSKSLYAASRLLPTTCVDVPRRPRVNKSHQLPRGNVTHLVMSRQLRTVSRRIFVARACVYVYIYISRIVDKFSRRLENLAVAFTQRQHLANFCWKG